MGDENRKVSLVITAKDQTSAALRGTSTAIRAVAAKIGTAFQLAGKGVLAVNAGLEIVKKALGALSAGFAATVGKALEMRAAWDSARSDLRAFEESIGALQVAVGDALIPIVQAFAQSLRPVIDNATAWLQANRELVASTLTDWLARTARLLTSGVAAGTLMVVRAWYGWKEVVGLVTAAIAKVVAKNLEGFSTITSGIAAAARAVGADGLAGRVSETSRSLDSLRESWDQASGKALEGVARDVAAVAALERGLAKVEGVVDRAIGQAAARAANNATRAIARVNAAYSEMVARSDEAYAEIENAMRAALAATQVERATKGAINAVRSLGSEYERLAKQAEIQDQLDQGMRSLRREYGAAADAAFKLAGSVDGARAALEEQALATEKTRETLKGVVGVIGGAFKGVLDDIIDGTKSAGEVIGGFFGSIGRGLLDMVVQMGIEYAASKLIEAVVGAATRKTAIAGYAAEAGAAAYAATAAIPFVGPALAPAAAATAYAGALAYEALGLAEGGLVTGGVMGRDSVHAALMPGEFVVPAAQVRANVAAGRAPDDSGSARGASGASITIVQQSFVPESGPAFARKVRRSVVPTLERERRAGRLRTA